MPWLSRLIAVKRGETRALLWSFAYFYLLLCSYYIIRPIRGEMVIRIGVDNLQWLLLATFLAMLAVVPLFGWLTNRVVRAKLLPATYLFFSACLITFYFAFNRFSETWQLSGVFFVWVNVFNLFVVSVFWSFMSDIFDEDQSRRLFAFIAAGGTAGALTGPLVTGLLVDKVGLANLMLVSAGVLICAIFCTRSLSQWARSKTNEQFDKQSVLDETKLAGSIWDGIRLVLRSRYLLGICLLILMYTLLSTFLAIQQAKLVETLLTDSAERTQLFAAVDFAANFLTLLLQLFLTSRIVNSLGLGKTLAILPTLLIFGFLAIAIVPSLAVMVVVQVVRRAGNYALAKPAREMLFVVLGREEKYKAKNFVDTTIHRSGDTISAWIFTGMKTLGMNAHAIALISAALAAVWMFIALWLGRQYDDKNSQTSDSL